MGYLLDTNIIIQLQKGNADLDNWLPLNSVIDTVVYIETLQGQKTNLEKQRNKTFLDGFALIPLSEEIGLRATQLIYQYSNTHNLLLPDALIAAASLEENLELITYNVKDFQFIKGLNIIQPSFPQI